MEVKPGYKQTEVGMIPEEWDVQNVGTLVNYTNGKAHEKNITDFGNFVVVNSKFISSEGLIRKYSKYCFCPAKTGDVLMVMSDVPNGKAIAKCYIVEQDNIYTINQRICILNSARINEKFLFYKLDRNPYYLAFDDGVKQTNLRKAEVLGCALSFPKSTKEQRAIAEALSDVDALLGALDRLIAKKRDLKQAAMQQLLTGKTRLPGFEGEWVVKRLGDLADIRSGGTPSTEETLFWDGDVPWCTPTDITALGGHKYLTGSRRLITQFGLKCSSAEMIPANSIIMTSRATIGECAINLIPVSTNQGFKNFVPTESVEVEFLYYLLLIQRQRFISLCAGSTFLEIGKGQLAPFLVQWPSTRAEQTAIANVLSDMDAELTALTQRRDKTQVMKQGMMQELLTGRTRLL